jgi:hypothetical protein
MHEMGHTIKKPVMTTASMEGSGDVNILIHEDDYSGTLTHAL